MRCRPSSTEPWSGNPFTVMYLCWKGYAHLVNGDLDEARDSWRTCATTERRSPWGLAASAWLSALDASPGAAEWRHQLGVIERLDRRNSGVPPVVHLKSLLQVRLGRPGAAHTLARLAILLPGHPWGAERFAALAGVPG